MTLDVTHLLSRRRVKLNLTEPGASDGFHLQHLKQLLHCSLFELFQLMFIHIYRDTPPSNSGTFIQNYSCSDRFDLTVTQ